MKALRDKGQSDAGTTQDGTLFLTSSASDSSASRRCGPTKPRSITSTTEEKRGMHGNDGRKIDLR